MIQRSHSLKRVLRLGLYLGLLLMAAGILSARLVAAEISERTLVLGQQLGSWQGFAGRGTDVLLNGQQLSLYTSTLKQPLGQVVEEFASLCSSGTALAASQLAQQLGMPGEAHVLSRMLMARDQRGDEEGAALCFAGLGDGGLARLRERFARFAEHYDVSELGPLRYLYARKVEDGTHVIFVTSTGPLSLMRLLPTDGSDADGVEPISGARPKDSTRFLSLEALGTPYTFTAYRSTRKPAELLSDYARQAHVRGFEVLDTQQLSNGELPAGLLGAGVETRVLERGKESFVVTSTPNDSGSLLSVVQLSDS